MRCVSRTGNSLPCAHRLDFRMDVELHNPYNVNNTNVRSKLKTMQTINERFKIIVERWYAGNDLKFAKSMGKYSSSFTKVINGTVNPRAATLQEVCKAIPELNPSWLLMGEGAITRTPDVLVTRKDADYYADIIKAKSEEIKTKDELISILKNYVEDLRGQLKT